MKRRQFLSFTVTSLAVSIVPASNLSALDFRQEKPQAWEAPSSDEAIKELYGSTQGISGKITLKIPSTAENGAVIPVNIKSKVKLESIAVFQDVNPRSAVAVISVPTNAIINYNLRLKMKGNTTSYITVMARDTEGKLYKETHKIFVSKGGCGG